MPECTKPKIVAEDGWLDPYTTAIQERQKRFQNKQEHILEHYKSLTNYASWHQKVGIFYNKKIKVWKITEWAPNAKSLHLVGDFNEWDRNSHPLQRNDDGFWSIELPKDTLTHGDLIKLHILGADGNAMDRIPSCCQRVIQDPKTHDFSGQIWKEKKFTWKHDSKRTFDEAPRIYEAHPGMAGEDEKVHDFKYFRKKVLPRIVKAGYNCIQLMAVAEHPYYGSFGYHVSNFFAVSSRFGSPNELKKLIDTAHKHGVAVLLDLVHSHSVKNLAEGLNDFDGTDYQYFHGGDRGNHPDWDSKLFNYGKEEVQQFLLSNIRYWLEEFHVDGFRFDGVTSMLYEHHGSTSFDHYDKYFIHGVDEDAILYLQLACTLTKDIFPNAILIAEDMSGMPGLARTIEDGGIGFDYRLAMGIPDFWIKLLKHKRDEEWSMNEIWQTLTNRRQGEKNVAYAESHDQALVGDKSLAFWLMDKEMYSHMSRDSESLIIDRGIALHKIIRLLTVFLGGEGYLNFIGNEFGHPEWVDFPREGNDWSYKYCRRQWFLVDHPDLRYRDLAKFDQQLMQFVSKSGILESAHAENLLINEGDQVLAAKRGSYILVANLNPQSSFSDYHLHVHQHGDHHVQLNTDSALCGGFGRIEESIHYPSFGETGTLSLYLPSRTGYILRQKK